MPRKARFLEPERRQAVMRFDLPDDRLGADHPARVVWRIVGQLDLSGFCESSVRSKDMRDVLQSARASLCELANAHIKCRFRLDRFLVRGTPKVTCVALLAAIAFNLLQHAASLLA